ncbi:SRPBCC family protein [Ascidiimonas sp. W6]|uniref:SRPBCC family protein n=1 Tax=Ascidiimonas meishanensis TaxID=3128903 RepID=UPI0030EC09DE
MQYQVEIEIDLARDAVIEKFNNRENFKHWQQGLLSLEHLSGIPGTKDAKTKLNYQMGKRTIEMLETITKVDFPESFHSTYEAKGVFNTQENYFKEVNSQKTNWISKSHFSFTSLTMKLVGFLFPSSFKKQSLKYMIDFKNFAENGISLANDQD